MFVAWKKIHLISEALEIIPAIKRNQSQFTLKKNKLFFMLTFFYLLVILRLLVIFQLLVHFLVILQPFPLYIIANMFHTIGLLFYHNFNISTDATQDPWSSR